MLDFRYSLGDSVRRAREEAGLTQTELADKVGMDARTILNIENYHGNPKAENLFALVRALHISPDEIFYPDIAPSDSSRKKLYRLLSDCTEQEYTLLLKLCIGALETWREEIYTQIK